MKHLFYQSLTIHSPNSVETLRDRLTRAIEPEKVFRFSWGFGSSNHAPYEGEVCDTGFKISRIIDYRNSFLPTIRGRFEPTPQGTTVQISLSLHPAVTVFLVVWYGIWYGATIPIFVLNGFSNPKFAYSGLVFLGLPIVTGIAFWLSFQMEARTDRQKLTDLLR
jgi:hypothetical protein